jgi:hypothetical protein
MIMAYSAPIQRSDPTAFLFLVDQSGSMGDRMAGEKTKAQFVADVLNRTLMNLVIRCTRAEGVRNYFEVGVIGYGGRGAANGFSGTLGGKILHPISDIEANPLRIEDRKKKTDDGAGGLVEQTVKFPVWFQPVSDGGTPMCAALTQAAEALVGWCDQHRSSYPPTVLHVTDGQSTDGDPEHLADMLRQISTDDGQVLLLNIHVSDNNSAPITFPSSAASLPDDYARMLFRMSSPLPDHLVKAVQEKGGSVTSDARGFVFNADGTEIVEFFDIGTRASQLR